MERKDNVVSLEKVRTARAWRRQRGPLGVWLAAATAVALLSILMVTTLTGGDAPQYQQRVQPPGGPAHLVNLWLDPPSPLPGPVVMTAQVADSGGWPTPPQAVTFLVARPGQEPQHIVQGRFSEEGPGRGMVFRGETQLPEPGDWVVTVRFDMGSYAGQAQFQVTVQA